VRAQEIADRDAVVVTVFCDDNKKYLSTALTHEEPLKPDYLTPQIELQSVGTVGRACEFCH
jgi:cysteine synthase